MKTLGGKALNINHTISGRVSRERRRLGFSRDTVLVCDNNARGNCGHLAVLTSASGIAGGKTPCVTRLAHDEIASLNDGDIVFLEPSGIVRRVWDVASRDNVVMVTNTCNCRCIMCPQPSGNDPEDQLSLNVRMLKLITNTDVSSIGFTGGEPTLRIDDLCVLLELCKKRFPTASISLLTNGRRYSNLEAAKRVAAVEHPSLTHCVSLNADVDSLHDHIMGASGSFREGIKGLHNLALLRQRVEIRVVLMRDNYERLPSLAEFIYRNLPFAAHIALMGMETTGLALRHIEEVWIEPADYILQLRRAVHHLQQRDLDVSIYNLPLCVLPRELWCFARDSISDWKKAFLEQCQACSVRERCPGVFATSEKHSLNIRPV